MAQWKRAHLPIQEMARDVGSVPGSGRSPGVGNGNPLQYSCLESPMDRGAWWATVHGVAKSQTQLNEQSTHDIPLCMYHVFLIHSSVDRHLGCFFVLAIVNSAAMCSLV